jgi:hypothetical protein
MRGGSSNCYRFSDPRLRDALSFLAEPQMYYESLQTKQPSFVTASLNMVNPNHPSIFKDLDKDQYPARQELKDIFDKISITAKTILENENGLNRAEFNKSKSLLVKCSKDILRLKNKYLTVKECDNVEAGIFHKFFEGNNTVDSVFINVTAVITERLKALGSALSL